MGKNSITILDNGIQFRIPISIEFDSLLLVSVLLISNINMIIIFCSYFSLICQFFASLSAVTSSSFFSSSSSSSFAHTCPSWRLQQVSFFLFSCFPFFPFYFSIPFLPFFLPFFPFFILLFLTLFVPFSCLVNVIVYT